MCSLLTLRAAELPANHAAAKAISSAQLHTGPGSRWAADRAALAVTVAAAQRKHLKEQTLCWGQRGVSSRPYENTLFFPVLCESLVSVGEFVERYDDFLSPSSAIAYV